MVRHRQQVAWGPVLWISVAALLGMPVGLLALLWLSARTLTVLIGLVLLAFIVVLIRAIHLPQRRAVEATVGFLSGTLLTSTGVNGPPIVAAFHAMRLPPVIFRGTLLATLCVQDVVAVCAFGALGQITPVCLVVMAAGLPGLALGWLVGDRVFARFRGAQFRWAEERAAVRYCDAGGLPEAIQGAHALLLWDFFSRAVHDVWDWAGELRWIHVAAAGVDSLLFNELVNADVVVTNARGVFERPIAEFVLGPVLAFTKDLHRSTTCA
jgi:hypothetical protein